MRPPTSDTCDLNLFLFSLSLQDKVRESLNFCYVSEVPDLPLPQLTLEIVATCENLV